MNAFAMFFAILGVSYVSWLIMKLIIWIDDADEPGCEKTHGEEARYAEPEERRSAA